MTPEGGLEGDMVNLLKKETSIELKALIPGALDLVIPRSHVQLCFFDGFYIRKLWLEKFVVDGGWVVKTNY